ncbi:MAG TPA: Rpn family recombination-promoting nuclease/putative transposase, partial [Spirochaetia bacterium]
MAILAAVRYSSDKAYKNLFSHPEIVTQLLTSFVDLDWVKEADYATLENVDRSFVTDEFKSRESDVIWKLKLQGKDVYVYLLIEFQSTVDRFMSLRMLRYICELYQALLKQDRDLKTLPAVFPVLIYSGPRQWRAPFDISALIEQSVPGRFLPSFSYYPILENTRAEERLLEIRNTLAGIFLLENVTPEGLREATEKLVRLVKDERPELHRIIVNWIRNVFGPEAGGEDTVEEIGSLQEVHSMLAETMERAAKKWWEEGRQEGEMAAVRETARRMKALGLPVEIIVKSTGLSSE